MYMKLPSPVTIREAFAQTQAEKLAAAAVENDAQSRDVVDTVNSALQDMRSLDGIRFDRGEMDHNVMVDRTPQELNWLQRNTGVGMTGVDFIAQSVAGEVGEVERVTGTWSEQNLELKIQGSEANLTLHKSESEDGTVVFKKNDATVTIDSQGNLVFED